MAKLVKLTVISPKDSSHMKRLKIKKGQLRVLVRIGKHLNRTVLKKVGSVKGFNVWYGKISV